MPGTVGPSPPLLSPNKPSSSSKKKSSSSKSSRPSTLSRKNTPQTISKLGGRREREWEEEQPEVGESFLQFCTYCEKQIEASSNNFLYCSELCRQHDLSSHTSSHRSPQYSPPQMHVPFSSSSRYNSPPRSPYSTTFFQPTDGPDIVPRASPSIARPRSYFGSEPLPTGQGYSAGYTNVSSSLPQQSGYAPGPSRDSSRRDEHRKSSSALASLRELSSALESSRSYAKPSKAPSSTSKSKSNTSLDREREFRSRNESSASSSSNSTGSSDAETETGDEYDSPAKSRSSKWSYAPTPSVFARTYSTPTAMTQATYQVTGKSYGGGGYSYGNPTGEYVAGMKGMDRPLPPRSAGFGHRPRSIDLVTPYGVGN